MKNCVMACETLPFDKRSFPNGTLAGHYLRWLDMLTGAYQSNAYKSSYLENIVQESEFEGERPFLSIIMRTQGKRLEPLREILLCLFAQSDQDFELILLGHKCDAAGECLIFSVLEEQDPTFRERIRYYPVDYGGRAAPLNFGFSHARGRYIVNCDDDDILMEDYVEQLHCNEEAASGRLMHMFIVTQDWSLNKVGLVDAPISESAPGTAFCTKFNLARQVKENYAPFSSIAFPAYVFCQLHIWFDEALETAEDWDYIMRVSMLLGVCEIEKVGGIYRLWKKAESSRTIHPQEDWTHNYHYIRDKIDDYPVLLRDSSSVYLADPRTAASATSAVQETGISIPEAVNICIATQGPIFFLKTFFEKLMKQNSLLFRVSHRIYNGLRALRGKMRK